MRQVTAARKAGAIFFAVLVGVCLPSAVLCSPAEESELETATTIPAEIASPPPADLPRLPASWKEEFERICAQTEIAASLSAEQLRQLISDSDELLGQLERLQNAQARIYVFRLRNCREFFAYALQLQLQKPDEDLSHHIL